MCERVEVRAAAALGVDDEARGRCLQLLDAATRTPRRASPPATDSASPSTVGLSQKTPRPGRPAIGFA